MKANRPSWNFAWVLVVATFCLVATRCSAQGQHSTASDDQG